MPDHEVAIIGAGLSGIGMGAALKRAGIEDFAIYERASDVGGTWRDNTYPGVGVDIPTFAYQFSYELKPDWSRVFARGAPRSSNTSTTTWPSTGSARTSSLTPT